MSLGKVCAGVVLVDESAALRVSPDFKFRNKDPETSFVRGITHHPDSAIVAGSFCSFVSSESADQCGVSLHVRIV